MNLTVPSDEQPRSPALSLLVFVAIAAVAYADWKVEPHLSFEFLYFLPLALSSFVFPLRISLGLAILCTILQDLFGPFSHEGWEHLLRNGAVLLGYATVVLVVTRMSRQRLEYLQSARRQRDAMEHELLMAADVQRRLLPLRPPQRPGYDIAGRMTPASLIGGDYYDYLELPDDQLGFVIADVSGHGVSAALMMPTVKTTLHMLVADRESTAATLEKLNRVLCDVTDPARFVSLFFARLDPARRQLEYTNAGHPPPLLYRFSTGEAFWLDKGGPVAGLLPRAGYESASAELLSGDVLVFYTDGVSEAWSEEHDDYARAQLRQLVAAHCDRTAESLVEAINRAVAERQGVEGAEDDATLIVVRVLKPS